MKRSVAFVVVFLAFAAAVGAEPATVAIKRGLSGFEAAVAWTPPGAPLSVQLRVEPQGKADPSTLPMAKGSGGAWAAAVPALGFNSSFNYRFIVDGKPYGSADAYKSFVVDQDGSARGTASVRALYSEPWWTSVPWTGFAKTDSRVDDIRKYHTRRSFSFMGGLLGYIGVGFAALPVVAGPYKSYSKPLDPGTGLSAVALGAAGMVGGYKLGQALSSSGQKVPASSSFLVDAASGDVVEEAVIEKLVAEGWFPPKATGRAMLASLEVVPSAVFDGYLVKLYADKERSSLKRISLAWQDGSAWHFATPQGYASPDEDASSPLGIRAINLSGGTLPLQAEALAVYRVLTGDRGDGLDFSRLKAAVGADGSVGYLAPARSGDMEYLFRRDGAVVASRFGGGLVPDGPTLVSIHGGSLEGSYAGGLPDGEFAYKTSKGQATLRFEAGALALDPSGMAGKALAKVTGLWTDIRGVLDSGRPLEAAEDKVLEWGAALAEVQGHGSDELLALALASPDKKAFVDAAGREWSLASLSSIEARKPDGSTESLSRRAALSRFGGDGLGLKLTAEEIRLRDEPAASALFVSGSFGGSLNAAAQAVGGSGEAGAGIRFVAPFGGFPGPGGGRVWGFDVRAKGLAGGSGGATYAPVFGVDDEGDEIIDTWETASSFGGSWSADLSLGASRLVFGAFDRETLKQSGSGFSLGLNASVGGLFGGEVSPSFAPYFGFDSYAYNPASASYKASSLELTVWPYPLNLSLLYSFSLF